MKKVNKDERIIVRCEEQLKKYLLKFKIDTPSIVRRALWDEVNRELDRKRRG